MNWDEPLKRLKCQRINLILGHWICRLVCSPSCTFHAESGLRGTSREISYEHLITTQPRKRVFGPSLESCLGFLCTGFLHRASVYLFPEWYTSKDNDVWLGVVLFSPWRRKGKRSCWNSVVTRTCQTFAFSHISVGSSFREKGRKGHLATRQLRAGPRAVSRNYGIF